MIMMNPLFSVMEPGFTIKILHEVAKDWGSSSDSTHFCSVVSFETVM
jgi:hypothetical protein